MRYKRSLSERSNFDGVFLLTFVPIEFLTFSATVADRLALAASKRSIKILAHITPTALHYIRIKISIVLFQKDLFISQCLVQC